MLTYVKKLIDAKNIFDSRNPSKNYDPRNMLTHVKNVT